MNIYIYIPYFFFRGGGGIEGVLINDTKTLYFAKLRVLYTKEFLKSDIVFRQWMQCNFLCKN